jgi:hypothetical protein
MILPIIWRLEKLDGSYRGLFASLARVWNQGLTFELDDDLKRPSAMFLASKLHPLARALFKIQYFTELSDRALKEVKKFKQIS